MTILVQAGHRPPGGTIPVRLAVDIGGTFTDIVIERGRERLTRKVLTTSQFPEQGVIEGARMVLGDAGLGFGDIETFVHGTTLATNAVLERRGAKTALIATAGFRDILEIGTEGRFEQYDLQIERRPPLIRRALRLTVAERMDARGAVLLPLDVSALSEVIEALRREAVESAAICFLHAYANGAHERKARDIVSAALPGLAISISSEVCPEIREYERTSTTVVNAYVQPLMSDYLARMEVLLTDLGFHGTLYLVASNGGLTSLGTARRYPVRLVESGPAGGAIFAAHIAARAQERRVLAFDMGGTTAKICLIDDFRPEAHRVYEVDRAARFQKGSGLPLRIPVIDLVEIGAGGGSVAQVNALGNVSVGPHSAGSEPGPACYGRGGKQATVTDADVVLGLIDPDGFAGGSVRLDLAAAEAALAADVGEKLGLGVEMAAYAVYELVCEEMASAARVHAIEKGRSTSNYTLMAFGGAAPLHAARVAEKIGAPRVIIPRNAGVGSAVGFLRAPVSFEVVRSRHTYLDELDPCGISDMLSDMEDEARVLVEPGARGEPITIRRRAFMRYVGQGHEIAVDAPIRRLLQQDRIGLRDAFGRAYTTLFNRIIPGARHELLGWSVLASTVLPDAGLASASEGPTAAHYAMPMPFPTRWIFDGRSGATVGVPVFRREDMTIGFTIEGPALISEQETTTFVTGSFDAGLDTDGNIVMNRKQESARGRH